MNKGRKTSGGKYHARRKRKSYEVKGQPSTTSLGEPKSKKIRIRGGTKKAVQLKAEYVNIKTEKGVKRGEITNVLETPQNNFLARQNRLMKGVLVETTLGKARITNRPARENVVNATLLKE